MASKHVDNEKKEIEFNVIVPDHTVPLVKKLELGSQKSEVAVALVRIWFKERTGKSKTDVKKELPSRMVINLLNMGSIVLDIKDSDIQPIVSA